jgi:hypothetical protein
LEKKFEIEFSKGGKFTAVLLMNEAPKTCAAFLKALPLEARFRQARFAGEEFFFQADMTPEAENQIPPKWGDISFNADPKWKAVCIYYGNNVKSSGAPFNLFARVISGNLEALKKVGERVWLQGEEVAHIQLLSKEEKDES